MAISLSEQLESDIKEYLHKTFGTYFSSLDERFAADIKEDVINASDFHHGYYNDDDISVMNSAPCLRLIYCPFSQLDALAG